MNLGFIRKLRMGLVMLYSFETLKFATLRFFNVMAKYKDDGTKAENMTLTDAMELYDE